MSIYSINSQRTNMRKINKFNLFQKFNEMVQILHEIESKFEFLINKTEGYLQPITEFLEKFFFV